MQTWLASDLLLFCKLMSSQNFGDYNFKQCFYSIGNTSSVYTVWKELSLIIGYVTNLALFYTSSFWSLVVDQKMKPWKA